MNVTSLAESHFENPFVENLPGDRETHNQIRQVDSCCYSTVFPTPVKTPKLISWSEELGNVLKLNTPVAGDSPTLQILSGNLVTSSMKPYAARYGGHQFGNWAGQLGDGRAITLGSLRGKDTVQYEIQLKGAGPTQYARGADGRAVLRSSVREFLCSEAMYYLGIPTTRALSLVHSGESVVRDMFYDGHPQEEPGAIVCRVAPTFLRFGNFEILSRQHEYDLLKQLADYTITNYFNHLASYGSERYLLWFKEISQRTAELVAQWMSVGFVHGVMNTDNMSITGLTIDYGPYGWLEPFEPSWTPNTTDAAHRRYAYGRQPEVGLWNLARLAEALIPLIPDEKNLESILKEYGTHFHQKFVSLLLGKLGIQRPPREVHLFCIKNLFELLEDHALDLTLFFRTLSDLVPTLSLSNNAHPIELLANLSYQTKNRNDLTNRLDRFLKEYAALLGEEEPPLEAISNRMKTLNPKFVLRNYLAHQAALQASEGDYQMINSLYTVLKKPFDEHPDFENWSHKRPEWANTTPGCSSLSCSS